MGNRETWQESIQSLGTAVVDLARAEVQAAARDLKVFFKQVGVLAGIGGGILMVLFYVPFILLFSAMDGIRSLTGWPFWGSALLLFTLVMLVIAVIVAVAYALIIRNLESPIKTVQRRLDDHKGWWRNDIFEEPRRLDDHTEAS